MPMTPPLLLRLKSPRTTLGPALYAAVLSLVVPALSGAVGIGLHLTGLIMGVPCLCAFRLQDSPPAPVGGLSVPYVAA